MILHYMLSNEDYIKFNLFHFGNSPVIKRQRLLLLIVMPVIMLSLVFFLIDRWDATTLVPIALLTVVWFFLYPRLVNRAIARNVNKLINEGQTNEFIGERSLTLQDSAMRIESQGRVAEIAYANIQRIAEDADRIYIYIGAISAVIIPVSAFASNADKQGFLNTLKQKVTASV